MTQRSTEEMQGHRVHSGNKNKQWYENRNQREVRIYSRSAVNINTSQKKQKQGQNFETKSLKKADTWCTLCLYFLYGGTEKQQKVIIE